MRTKTWKCIENKKKADALTPAPVPEIACIERTPLEGYCDIGKMFFNFSDREKVFRPL